MLQLLLASQSPRRRELLDRAGYKFTVAHVKVSETIDENLNPEENASQIATKKAQACFDQFKSSNSQGFLILGADTLVAVGDQILGKPADSLQAADFLRLLSGRTHRVITGFCLLETGSKKRFQGFDSTDVEFKRLSEQDIQTYVASGEPMDRAGAYAIQGGAGKFVSEYRGSWSNVVGLPMESLEEALKQNGWMVDRRSP